MHPYVSLLMAEQRGADMRADAAAHRRVRAAKSSGSGPLRAQLSRPRDQKPQPDRCSNSADIELPVAGGWSVLRLRQPADARRRR